MNQIKKYIGSSMNEILDQVRNEMGEDAIIIQSSSKGSRFGGVQRFEVIAGTDSPLKKKPVSKFSVPASGYQPVNLSVYRDNTPKNKPRKEEDTLTREIQNLKGLLKTLIPAPSWEEHEGIKKLRLHLLDQGAEREITEQILWEIKNLLKEKINRMNKNQIQQVALALMEKKFKQKFQNAFVPKLKNIVLVGPTGAGKTTTLAKLASIAVLEQKQKVCLVSLDFYRLGALNQLKAYAEILSVPFFAVKTPDDLKKILKANPDCRFFIDTSGVSPLNGKGIGNIGSFFYKIPDLERVLVLSSTYPSLQMSQILSSFKITEYQSIILTKLDEIAHFGHLLSLLSFPVKCIKYITNGQEVPKDILSFKPSLLVTKIIQDCSWTRQII